MYVCKVCLNQFTPKWLDGFFYHIARIVVRVRVQIVVRKYLGYISYWEFISVGYLL